MKNSEWGKLNEFDFYKGIIVTAISTSLSIIYSTLDSGALEINWKSVGMTALCSAIGYVIKNLFTDENGNIIGTKKPM
jgi:hypothetical protein